MAMSARVTNANGRIIAEKRNGQRRYHQHDALGNTIALIDDAGTVTNTFSYWPYGELRSPVIGNLPTPFLYCGRWGYYTDTTGRIYVRARTYRPVFTRWLTVDPLWPWERAYGYGNTSPTVYIDPSGARFRTFGCVPDLPLSECCTTIKGVDPRRIAKCVDKAYPGSEERVIKFFKWLNEDVCNDLSATNSCIFCMYNGHPKEYCAANPCAKYPNIAAQATHMELPPFVPPTKKRAETIGGGACPYVRSDCAQSLFEEFGCTNLIAWCMHPSEHITKSLDVCDVFVHELAHNVGFTIGPDHSNTWTRDIVYRIECCFCREAHPTQSNNCRICNNWGDSRI
jgi:RHS repeat-associated protein